MVNRNAKERKKSIQGNQSQNDMKLDTRGDGMYSGTFRWLESKSFPSLPPFPQANQTQDTLTTVHLKNGWEGYLRTRSSESVDLVKMATSDPSCLDALTFPITCVYVAQLLQLCTNGVDTEKHVLVIGATRKAEQRVWNITDYWSEIGYFFPDVQVKLWFIGPEADTTCAKKTLPSNMSVRHFRGTFGEFQNANASHACKPSNSIIIGYNTGFGNFVDSHHHGLLFSWLPDLYKIADSKIPAIFTCANDYADMNGEFAVQSRIIGAKMLLLPQQNPFSAASHLHEEGQRDTAWSRGNSFLYAILGYNPKRRVNLQSGDITSLQKRLDEDLDLHLQDKLGRHFIKGTVLSKEQASRYTATTGSQTTHSIPVNLQKTPKPQSQSGESTLETPHYDLLPGTGEKEIIMVVHLPKITSPSERFAVDLTDFILTVFVPQKYLLRLRLPFEVDNSAAVGNLCAKLSLPFLRLCFTRK